MPFLRNFSLGAALQAICNNMDRLVHSHGKSGLLWIPVADRGPVQTQGVIIARIEHFVVFLHVGRECRRPHLRYLLVTLASFLPQTCSSEGPSDLRRGSVSFKFSCDSLSSWRKRFPALSFV